MKILVILFERNMLCFENLPESNIYRVAFFFSSTSFLLAIYFSVAAQFYRIVVMREKMNPFHREYNQILTHLEKRLRFILKVGLQNIDSFNISKNQIVETCHRACGRSEILRGLFLKFGGRMPNEIHYELFSSSELKERIVNFCKFSSSVEIQRALKHFINFCTSALVIENIILGDFVAHAVKP